MRRQPLEYTSQWLPLSKICYSLSLIRKNIIVEANNTFLLLIKIASIFRVNNSLTEMLLAFVGFF